MSNEEKVIQKSTIQPKGQNFEAIQELKDYVSENDKHLIYSQYVFKTSIETL